MTNLLSAQRKIQLLWRGRVRTIMVSALMLIFGLMVAGAALLPVALYSRVVSRALELQIEDMMHVALPNDDAEEVSDESRQRQHLTQTLKRDKDLIEYLTTVAALPALPGILARIQSLVAQVQGAALTQVSLEAHADEGIYVLRLSGKAASRGEVVSLRGLFEQSGDFVLVDFPISNLTPSSGEYIFSMVLHTVIIETSHE